ncbi:DUF58 domain-containing protein [Lysinibacter cavernae]|uniref:Uncharacterized protein (DUF58 family) n=1 Tax=Lysinibacter cavernae TaxID=1640652 RepID=A0A7X5R1D9_9MICO|nr:DUF58 domain-containing protein [Lysinibacter cavernae]NIH53818.1 uncharacterized protein (DUF58 family) [Lysinibacter cavernae]
MAVSGWFVLLVLLGIVPVVLVDIVAGDNVAETAAFFGSEAPASPSMLMLAAWLIVCLLAGLLDLVLAASARNIVIERQPIGALRLGQSTISELVIFNPGRRNLHGLIRDGWEPSAGMTPSRSRISVPAGERRLSRVQLTPFRRGERNSPHVTIRSYGPLRLWARQATHASQGSVRVLPAFNSRRHLPSLVARLKELDGRTLTMVRGQGTEFDSLREYVRGDDVRSIDWRATARRGDVVVRTWRPERDRRVVLIVDSGRTSAARIDNEPRIDTAFEASLLLSALADRAGDRIDFMVHDRRTRARVQGANGASLLQKLVDAMAPISPELLEMDWAAVPKLVRGVTTQKSLVVLLTTADSPGTARPLLAMLPQLTAKHTVVVAGVMDPALAEASAERLSRDDVYRAAAAERAINDQQRVAAAIRLCGAYPLSATPQQLPPALANHYLALKASGQL